MHAAGREVPVSLEPGAALSNLAHAAFTNNQQGTRREAGGLDNTFA
jgi:ectoine hydroxylase-related dioxygenase (phytanoyl-CoA dioxygenase family)